jgi:hypothetical protein
LVGEEEGVFAEVERIIWARVARKMHLYPEDNRLVVKYYLSGYSCHAHLLIAYEMAGEWHLASHPARGEVHRGAAAGR